MYATHANIVRRGGVEAIKYPDNGNKNEDEMNRKTIKIDEIGTIS